VSRASRGIALGAASLPLLFLLSLNLAGYMLPNQKTPVLAIAEWLILASKALFVSAIFGSIFAVLFPAGGLSLVLAGLVVVRHDGRPAGRFRCFSRALVAWAPILLLTLVPVDDRLRPLALLLTVLLFAGAIFAWMHPQRGLQDRIVGTGLVPR
jgi:hypothetical protein